MAEERSRQRPAETPPAILADNRLRTGAGTPVTVRLMITNRADEPRVMVVTVLGVDASWLPEPSRSKPLAPGEAIAADLTLFPAVGTVPARYPLAIAVQAVDLQTGAPTSATQIAEVDLVVDAPGQVAVGLEPADATAVFSRRITITLHNTGTAPTPVHLDVTAPQSTHVSAETTDVDVPPGEVVRVLGRIRVARPRLFGPRSRHTYRVTAHSAGSPRYAEGSLTARAMFGPSGTKATALIGVLVLWVALALIFIPKLSDKVRTREAAGPGTVTSQSASPGASTAPGQGSGSPGSSGSASPGAPGTPGATAGKVQFNGTVTGDAPGDVTVVMRPTSLVDEETVGAVPVGVTTLSDEVGMIPASAVTVIPPSSVSSERGEVTGADGAWSFADVTAPGYYLLTFSKPGYQTQRYIIDSAATVATQPLKVNLIPGKGKLSGTVRGPSGPVGAAQIIITDGINTITTSSNSKGDVGAWSVDGLSTPSTYLVSASKAGLSTESVLVPLAAGGNAQAPLTLTLGVGSLVGYVRGVNSLGRMGGIGGVQVTATDGTLTRTASTVTTGPVGRYTLADLPPGRYTVTVDAPGYLPQTRRVTLAKGVSKATMSAVLTSATATVSGRVLTSAGGALNGAGLVLSSSTESYKITSTSDGSFAITGVAPGTYVLSAEYFGYGTGYATVKAVAGRSSAVTIRLSPLTTTSFSWITGYVGSATSPGNTLCPPKPTDPTPDCWVAFMLYSATDPDTPVPIANDKAGPFVDKLEVRPAPDGPTAYTLYGQGGIDPGLYRLTIAVRSGGGAGALSYLPATIRVRVPLDGEARAPQVNLFPTNTIGGTISALGDLGVDGTGTTYVNCVYAVPLGDPIPDLSKCDPTFDDTSPCLVDGTQGNGYAPIEATKVYSMSNLCDGTYDVYLAITNPDYVAPAPVARETVSHGQTVNYSPHVFRKGRVVITLYEDKNGTPVRRTAALVGTAACDDSTVAQLSTAVNGQVIVTGVTAGTRNCTVTATDPELTGTTTNVAVSNDLDTHITVTLVKTVGSFWGRVVSNHGTSAAPTTPVSHAQVTIEGITGYDGTLPTHSSVTVTTDDNGCFAITPDGGVPYDTDPNPPPTTPCGTVAAGNTNAGPLTLLSSTVTVSAPSVTGYQAIAPTQLTVEGGTIPQLTLVPSAVSVALSVTFRTEAGGTPSPAPAKPSTVITVDADEAPGAGTVRVTVDSDGDLVWSDSNYGTGPTGAWPGVYTLTAALDGYTAAPVSATVTCTLGGSCTYSSGSLTLYQLGALSGTIIAVLGTPTDLNPPTQPLVGATVTAQLCTEPPGLPATTCTPAANSSFSVLSGVNGNYAITTPGSNSPFVLPLGWYEITVSATGYTAASVIVRITSGTNTATIGPTSGRIALFITLTTIDIGIVTASNPDNPPTADQLTDAATITLTRLDTMEKFPPDSVSATTKLYRFNDLVPAVYQVTISGTGLVQTFNYLSLPYATSPPTTKAYYFTAGIQQNAVAGSVEGLQGSSTTPTALNGVTVELGTMSGTNFNVSKGSDGLDLVTTTASAGGVDGTFSFTTVKDGTYTIRYSGKYGYKDMYGPSQVIVQGGQFVSLPTVEMARVAQKVTVTLHTSTGNDPSGWPAKITNIVDGAPTTWTLTADTSPTSTSPYRWVFNQVPFGCWSFSVTLPVNHYGSISLTTTPPTDTNVPCASGNFTVRGTGTTDVAPGYTLNESQLDLTVSATGIGTDTVPITAYLTVTLDGAASAIYEQPAFPIDDTATTTLWLPSGTYDIFVRPADTTAFPQHIWPSVTANNLTLKSTEATAPTLALKEMPKLVVTVTGAAAGAEATVTVAPGPGQNATVPDAYASGVDTTDGVATLHLPVGKWEITATLDTKTDTDTVTMVELAQTDLTSVPA